MQNIRVVGTVVGHVSFSEGLYSMDIKYKLSNGEIYTDTIESRTTLDSDVVEKSSRKVVESYLADKNARLVID